MKTRNYDLLVIGILIGTISTVLIDVLLSFMFSLSREGKSPGNVSQHIKTEYFLEVSEDSIRIESKQGLVYSGKYSDLDSLINADNL
jgi:hypothetical protein